MGPFDRVVTSVHPRAFETAIAMGFAVDERWAEIGSMPDEVDAQIDWRAGCAAFQTAMRGGGAVSRYCADQGRLLRALASTLPDGGRALVVSHGGIVEAQTVGSVPDYDYSFWGVSCGYCEGVRLRFGDGQFTSAELVRVAGSELPQ